MRKIFFMFVLMWAMKDFLTISGALDFINSLPEQRGLESKIVVSPNTKFYCVLYRTEK